MITHGLEEFLAIDGDMQTDLHKNALQVKIETLSNKVYTRALIEVTNFCNKDCLYCGIRNSNNNPQRYKLKLETVVALALSAYKNGYRSLVLQSGEINSEEFTLYIAEILKKISKLTAAEMHITLSCGEQTKETLAIWKQNGAHRYLLRIESSNRELYYKLHPKNITHSFENRRECLIFLRELGYQVGTGFLIGVPDQTLTDIANDIKFIKEMDIDMVGLGPYIEHPDTPLFKSIDKLPSKDIRLKLTLNTIALLRLQMPDINIAASTSCEAISKFGRELAILAGANVIMPNFTPNSIKEHYDLYPGKINAGLKKDDSLVQMEQNLKKIKLKIESNEWGDSIHFKKRSNR